jgi:hypothetical protein
MLCSCIETHKNRLNIKLKISNESKPMNNIKAGLLNVAPLYYISILDQVVHNGLIWIQGKIGLL